MRLLITVLLCLNLAYSGTIKGRITFDETGEPLAGANVLLLGTSNGATSNANGDFTIRNVPIGTWRLKFTYVGCKTTIDTVIIKTDNQVAQLDVVLAFINKTYEVSRFIRDSLSEVEATSIRAYQQVVDSLSRRTKLLTMTIDTLFCNDQGYMFAQLSFTNNTNVPLYLLKDHFCLRRFNARITRNESDTNRSRAVIPDYYGEKCIYDQSDLVEISPQSTVRYPLTQLWLEICSEYEPGEYEAKLTYRYSLPDRLMGDPTISHDQFIAYLKAYQCSISAERPFKWVKE
jgi:hypothetical protein